MLTESDRDLITVWSVCGMPDNPSTREHAVKLLVQLQAELDEVHRNADGLVAKVRGMEAAAESDGAAQAVCRALVIHEAHGGSIPWPSVRRPFEEWQIAHARATGEMEATRG